MPNCGAPNCTNRSNEENGKNKTFHKLPAESRKNIRKEWLVKIKRQHVPKHLYVCSDHFEPECYEKNMQVSAIAYFHLLFFQVLFLLLYFILFQCYCYFFLIYLC